MKDNAIHLKRIVDSCKQGDNKGREELYNMFSSRMMALCYRYLGNKEDAEDVMADGFIDVFEKIDMYKDGNFYGWLRVVMTNKCLAFLNKQKYNDQKAEDYANDTHEHIEITDAEERFTKKDLQYALDQLPKALRTVFNLSVIDGYSHDEICTLLNISKNTVKADVYKAKVILKRVLTQTEQRRRQGK